MIHPQSDKTFGFDKGRRVLLQEEFPQARSLVDGTATQLVFDTAPDDQQPMMAAFITNPVQIAGHEARLILGLAKPLGSVLAQADQLGRTTLNIVLGFALTCIVLAALLARAITRPLNTLSRAVRNFTGERLITQLPLDRHDEIGVLARSFERMQALISQQLQALESSRQELSHLARHDVLTGLLNRRLFLEQLDSALERAKRSGSLALLFIDLDKFKDINDQHGHDAGDAALQGVAWRLLANIRKVDMVARMGGDDFVVLLDNPSNRAQVMTIAQKLCDCMREPMHYGPHELAIGLSIGISIFPQDGDTADQLITRADSAMYRVKTSHRNNFSFASDP